MFVPTVSPVLQRIDYYILKEIKR